MGQQSSLRRGHPRLCAPPRRHGRGVGAERTLCRRARSAHRPSADSGASPAPSAARLLRGVGRTADQCDPLGIGAHRHRRWLRHIPRAGGEQPCPRPHRRRSTGGCAEPTGYHHRLVVRQEVSTRTRGGASGGWTNIPAVRDGELHEIKSPIILQPGPAALTDGLDALHTIIARWTSASYSNSGGIR